MRGFLADPSEELIKLIRAEADEPHHSDLEAALPLCVCNYTCIISAVNSGHNRHFLLLFLLPLLLLVLLLCHHTDTVSLFAIRGTHSTARYNQGPTLPSMTITLLLSGGLQKAAVPSWRDWETRVIFGVMLLAHANDLSIKAANVIQQASAFYFSPLIG